jgi:hypothetical protein
MFGLADPRVHELVTVNDPQEPSTVRLSDQEWPYPVSTFVVCPGDIWSDGVVDASDLGALLEHYDPDCDGDPEYEADVDLDNSGCVDVSDLAILIAHFGVKCE